MSLLDLFRHPSKKKIEEREIADLGRSVEKQVESLKKNKEKRVLEQKRQLAEFNATVDKYGVDGIWFLAFGGIDERKK